MLGSGDAAEKAVSPDLRLEPAHKGGDIVFFVGISARIPARMASSESSAADTLSAAPMVTSAAHAHVRVRGSAVARFVLLDPLGGGASGTVYSAFDPILDRQVAIKLIHVGESDAEGTSQARARVLREAQAMARIKHPNVVPIYDAGVADDGEVFLALEKVSGGTLADWLQKKRPWREVLRVLCAAGDGLAAAHAVGVIHRDFKPTNVLMDSGSIPRVTDFGLAWTVGAAEERRGEDGSVDASGRSSSTALGDPLTETGTALGTPGYMPPEQYGAHTIDERADVFAFCASAYRALYGERPFAGDTAAEVANATLNEKIRPPPKSTDVPKWVERIVLGGLSKDREARPSSMNQLLAALRNDPAQRRWRWIGVGAALLACLVGASSVRAGAARRAQACVAAGAPLESIWGPARKAQIAAAFAATRRPYAADAWAQVEHALDEYSAEWLTANEASCAATRVRGEQSETMFELRATCFEDHLDELRALADVFASADAKVVETAARAARALSPLKACSDIDRLNASLRMPQAPAAREEIRALQAELSRTKELHEAGKKRQSRDALDAIHDRVERAAWPPLLVQWHTRAATSERQVDEKAAVAHYEEAITLAERNRLDERKASAEIALGSFEGSWLGRTEEAHLWMRMADASIARLGGNAELELEREEEEGWIFQYEHKLTDAARLFRRVLDRTEAAGIGDPDIVASAHSGLADALTGEGNVDEAMAHERLALRTEEQAYGREHPWISGYLNNLAVAELSAGQIDAALASATRARDLLDEQASRGEEVPASSEHALALHTLGEVLLRARRFGEAADELSRARDMYRAVHDGPNADVAYADNELAAAFLELGRGEEATRALEEASSIERATNVPAAIVGGTLVVKARSELRRGDLRGASAHAEQALATMRDGDARGAELAEAQLTLAAALAPGGGNSVRVRELAESARAAFEKDHDEVRREQANALLVEK